MENQLMLERSILAALVLVMAASVVESQQQVVSFDGTGGQVQVPNSADLRPPAAITIECWSISEGGSSRLINMGDGISGHTNRSYDLSFTSTDVVGWFFFAGGDGTELRSTVDHGEWLHIAMTFDSASGLARLIIDGEVEDSESTTKQGQSLVGESLRASS